MIFDLSLLITILFRTPNGPICGGNGKCACGKCQCDSNTVGFQLGPSSKSIMQVSGEFCSCDNTSCPVGGPDSELIFDLRPSLIFDLSQIVSARDGVCASVEVASARRDGRGRIAAARRQIANAWRME